LSDYVLFRGAENFDEFIGGRALKETWETSRKNAEEGANAD
jgi:hypothetical protein